MLVAGRDDAGLRHPCDCAVPARHRRRGSLRHPLRQVSGWNGGLGQFRWGPLFSASTARVLRCCMRSSPPSLSRRYPALPSAARRRPRGSPRAHAHRHPAFRHQYHRQRSTLPPFGPAIAGGAKPGRLARVLFIVAPLIGRDRGYLFSQAFSPPMTWCPSWRRWTRRSGARGQRRASGGNRDINAADGSSGSSGSISAGLSRSG